LTYIFKFFFKNSYFKVGTLRICLPRTVPFLFQEKISGDTSEGVRMKLRALLVALLGVSMSACAFASQPVELELDDDEVAQKLNNVSFARR
jgi:hypothetical protein